jgi:hypothetical protein
MNAFALMGNNRRGLIEGTSGVLKVTNEWSPSKSDVQIIVTVLLQI